MPKKMSQSEIDYESFINSKINDAPPRSIGYFEVVPKVAGKSFDFPHLFGKLWIRSAQLHKALKIGVKAVAEVTEVKTYNSMISGKWTVEGNDQKFEHWASWANDIQQGSKVNVLIDPVSKKVLLPLGPSTTFQL